MKFKITVNSRYNPTTPADNMIAFHEIMTCLADAIKNSTLDTPPLGGSLYNGKVIIGSYVVEFMS